MSSTKEALGVRSKSIEILSSVHFHLNQDQQDTNVQNLPPDYSYLKPESCLRHVIPMVGDLYDVIIPNIAALAFNGKHSFPPLDWGNYLKGRLADDDAQKVVISLAGENKTCASLLPQVAESSYKCEQSLSRAVRFLPTFNKHSSPELAVEILKAADGNIKAACERGSMLVRCVLFGCQQILESDDLLPLVRNKILETLKLMSSVIEVTESTEIWTCLVQCLMKVTAKNVVDLLDFGGEKVKKLRVLTIMPSTSTERVFDVTVELITESSSVISAGLYATLEWYLGSVLGEKGYVEWLQRLMASKTVNCKIFAVSVQIIANCSEKRQETFDGLFEF